MARVRTHPGEVLREEFLVPLGLSAHQLANAIDVPANRVSEIVREARSVTADTALRLARHFDTTPEFWLYLQIAHDLSKAKAGLESKIRVGKAKIRKWTKRDVSTGKFAHSSAALHKDLSPKSSKKK
jgi:antitoxin HigA-1